MHRSLCALVIALFASACSTGVETRVQTSGVTALESRSYFVTPTEYEAADLKTAHNLVESILTTRGFVRADIAPLHLQVTVDSRDASLALGSEAGPQSLSPAKRRKPLQSCADKEFRVGITLTRVADGLEIYHSRVSEHHCKLPLADALPTMINAALADMGKPRGSYTILHNGIE